MHGPAITSYYTLSDPNAPGVGAAERKRIASIPAAWQAVKPGRDTGPQAPTIRRVPPDAGAARELADLFPAIEGFSEKFWAKQYNPEKRARVEGGYATDELQILRASAHVALLAHRTKPAGKPLQALGRLPDFRGEPIALLGADFWRAYARVRTCRAQGKAKGWITLSALADGVYLSAEDLDGNSAKEHVPTGTGIRGFGFHRTKIEDAYLWPLRGRAWFWRQQTEYATHAQSTSAPYYASDPACFEHASGLVAVIMPGAKE